MKKGIILSLAAIGCIFALTGCSGGEERFTAGNYTADGGQVKEIVIDVRDRAIDISASEDERIYIGYSDGEKEYYDISLSESSVLTMKLADDKEWSDYVGGKSSEEFRTISVRIPENILDGLSLSTTNEDIVIAPLSVSDSVVLSSNGGDIIFDKLDAGRSISVTGKNGDISGTIVGGYDDYAISCNVKKGECNLPESKPGGEKTLNIENNNGDTDINFEKE